MVADTERKALTSSPWLTIWYSPRKTIRSIVESNPNQQLIILAALIGISFLLEQLSTRNIGDTQPLFIIFIIAAIAGPLLGIIFVYILGALLHWTGSWFGGQASATETRAAYAWSWVPNLWILVLWIPKLALFGMELFTSTTPRIESNPVLALILLAFSLIELVVGIWVIIIFILCLSEVHRFSIWKAIATFVLSLVIIGIPLFLLLALMSGLYIGP
jgi:hypothetical protein